MGFALAQAAWRAGAEVTLVAGPVSLPTPRGVRRLDVRSAQDMWRTTEPLADQSSVFIAAAAVADWRPAQEAERKIKKTDTGHAPELQFVQNTDILATIARSQRALSGQLFCVGFAAESHDLMAQALEKRQRKGVPLLVGNIGPQTFGLDDNALLVVDAQGAEELPRAPKRVLAARLVERIARELKK
jgi:phosphopantothenoylcysteine decarboxylase/phosphopantothenate--cysteine ligase